jgi:hypothetical protein
VACNPSTERGILFEHVPIDIDAPVVIEATIYDETQVGDAAGNQMVLMNARVDRVIKGSIDAKWAGQTRRDPERQPRESSHASARRTCSLPRIVITRINRAHYPGWM